jgi:competence protein ComEC
MRQSAFYPAVFGYTLGIFLRSLVTLSFSFELTTVFWLAGIFVILWYRGEMYDIVHLKRYSINFLAIIVLLFVAFGAIRYSFFTSYHGDPLLAAMVGKKIQAEGIIVAEPDVREKSVRLTVAIDTLIETNSIGSNSRVPLEPTKVIMSADPSFQMSYDDRISVSGALAQPDNFMGDNGRIFDYVSYLAKDRILYVVNYPKTTFISSGQGNKLESGILFLKNKFLDGLDAVVPKPESDLGAGLVIAGKRALPTNIQNEFQKSGTIQVIVLSGYNVTVVAETLASLFSFLPNLAGAALGTLGILVFTIAAGVTATVVRASIMALVVIAAKLLRRRYDVIRALIFSAFIMLIGNPLLLVFDPSFQLSFIATFGLIIVSPMIEKYFHFLPETMAIRATAVATVATQIFVLPFLLYLTGMFSIVAVPANLLLFLFIPMTMLFCFVAGILGWLRPILIHPLLVLVNPLAAMVAIPTTALLHYQLLVVHAFASLPFAAFTVSTFPALAMFLVYAGYAVVVGRFYYCMKRATNDPLDAVTMALIKDFHPSPPDDSGRPNTPSTS